MKQEPLRMCIVDRKMYKKSELYRLILQDDNIVIDRTQKQGGRGIWIQKNANIITQAQKKRVLNRVLHREVPNEIYEELLSDVGQQ